ncbi:hypothetical protein [Bacillus safensis]|uniref:hypothetical protein n=1 Tax=Bacillus safensis TaxID=561879 RepID=UPI00203516FD|nr:hypothetical protein [Bacillus safensis]
MRKKHAFFAGVCSMIVICSAAILLQHLEWIKFVSGGISIIGVVMSGVLMGAWTSGEETRKQKNTACGALIRLFL